MASLTKSLKKQRGRETFMQYLVILYRRENTGRKRTDGSTGDRRRFSTMVWNVKDRERKHL